MRFDTFLIADAATVADGKLYMHGGGITRFQAPQFPFLLPHLALVVRFLMDEADYDERHEVGVAFVDPGGEAVFPPQQFSVESERPPNALAGEERVLQLVVNLGGLPLQREGLYRFVLQLDGEDQREMTLPAAAMPAAPDNSDTQAA